MNDRTVRKEIREIKRRWALEKAALEKRILELEEKLKEADPVEALKELNKRLDKFLVSELFSDQEEG
jgi:hypothetical protein